jgi:hypothetical protein
LLKLASIWWWKPQEVEAALAVLVQEEKARLGVGQRKPELSELRPQFPQRRLGLRPGSAPEDEVIGIADQHAQLAVPLLPRPVERVQIDVGDQGRDRRALRRAELGALQSLPLQQPGFQPAPQLQQPPVADPLAEKLLEDRRVERVEEAAAVGVDQPAPPPHQLAFDFVQRLVS